MCKRSLMYKLRLKRVGICTSWRFTAQMLAGSIEHIPTTMCFQEIYIIWVHRVFGTSNHWFSKSRKTHGWYLGKATILISTFVSVFAHIYLQLLNFYVHPRTFGQMIVLAGRDLFDAVVRWGRINTGIYHLCSLDLSRIVDFRSRYW